jgi:hypothetical protein
VRLPLVIRDFYYPQPLAELEGPVFDYAFLIRETLLLQTPPFAECNGGNCSERTEVNKYLKKPTEVKIHHQPTYFPFSDLN